MTRGTGSSMRRVLIVTNDFPPRRGGIQSFVHALAARLPEGTVCVYAPAWDGAARFDAQQPFPVVRHRTSLMLPVPTVARRAASVLADYDCDTVLFGAAAPLGLLAPSLRRAGARRVVALTHGHEAGWAAPPVARSLLRRIGDEVDVMTYLGEYFRVRLAAALSPQAAARMVRLAPGVDTGAFRPGAGGAAIRQRLGIGPRRPVVVCVSRMVPRKGQDTLLRAWPQVRAQVGGDPVLLLVGDGPYRAELGRLADRLRLGGSVLFGGPVQGAARLLRRGQRVRDAVPDPARRPGRGGPRDRLPGGVGHGAARGGRRLGRRAGRDPGGRDGLRGAGPQRGSA